MAKDGVVSIAIDYKNELNQMIRDYESALTEMASNDKLSKGMKSQFDSTIAELKRFKADMEKSFSDLSIGKVDKNSFKAFKQTVNKNFESVRAEIDNLNLAVSTINSQIKILGNGIDISKISSQFKNFQDYVQNTNNAIDTMIKKLDGQGISLMSFDDSAVNQAKSQIKEINKLLKSTDEFSDAKGSKYELFDTDQAQAELDVLARDLKNTLELIEKSESELSNFDKNSIGFEKTINQINILKLKAADLHDSIQQLMDIPDKTGEYTFGDSILISDDNVDKKVSEYGKIVKGTLDEFRESAIKTREELEKVVTPNSSKTASAKISDKLNPNSAELVTGITIETTSSELWKKLSPIIEDLQNILNKNPVVAPVKLVVAPNAVSSEKNDEVGTISKSYSKKYQRELAKTGEDAVIDLEGVYKKTFTSIMDEAVSYSKETISKIQNIFESSPIKLYFDFNEEEFKKLSDALLSSDSGKKIDITGQIAESKKEVNELAEKLAEVNELLNSADSKDFSFKGFDKFTEEISKSLGQLTELQSMLKTLQNIESVLARASGVSSVTDIETQWQNVSKLIENSIKLDGTFRKNANINKLATEYNKYLNMGGTNELSSIGKIGKLEDSKNIIDTILSKVKELNSQKVDTSSVDKADNELKSVSSTLDDVISRLDHMINLTRDIGNTFWKMFKDASVSEVDKQWSSIESKFKSIADESGKINLSKQKKDIQELMGMYQKYSNAGGMKTLFDLTDNTETIKKLNKVYEKLNETKTQSKSDNKIISDLSEVNKSVDSLANNLDNKLPQASNIAATAIEDSAERQISALTSVVDNINLIVEGLKKVKGVKIPEIKINNTNSDNKSKSTELTSIEKERKAIEGIIKNFSASDDVGDLFNDFFDDKLSESMKSNLKALSALKSNGDIDYSHIGMGASLGMAILGNNLGVVIRDKNNKNNNWDVVQEYYNKLSSALSKSYDEGANVARILDVIIDKAHNAVYEIQDVAKGEHAYEDASDTFFSPSAIAATDEQIKKLIHDLLILNKNCLAMDMRGDNLKFDGSVFSMFDMSLINSPRSDYEVIDSFINSLSKRNSSENGKNLLSRINNIAQEYMINNSDLNQINQNINDNKKLLDTYQKDIEEEKQSVEEYIQDMKGFGEDISEEEVRKAASEYISKYQEKIAQIEKLNVLLEKHRQELEANIDAESKLVNISKDSTNESNISSRRKDAFLNADTKLDETVTSAKDLDKTLEQIDIPTDSFDKVLERLDRTKSELVDIIKITRKSVSDKDGKFHDSYTLKDSRGSTEIYGMSSKTDKGQILDQNIVKYDVKKDAVDNSKELLAIEKQLQKEIEASDKANQKKFQDFQKEQADYAESVDKVNSAIQKTDEILDTLPLHDKLDGQFLDMIDSVDNLNSKLKSGELTLSEYKNEVKSVTSEYSKMVSIQQKRDVEDYNANAKANLENAKSIKEEWTNAIKTVKEYESAVSKLNNLKASDRGLGIKSNEIAEQEKKIDDMKSSFDAAQTTIISFFSSIDKFNTLPVSSIQEVSDAIKLIQTASKGSAESVAKLEDALRNVEKVNLDNFEKEKNQKINKLLSYTDGTKYTSEFKSRVSDEIAKIQKLQISNSNDVTTLKQIDSEIQEIINDSKLLENKLVKQKSHLADIISQMKIYRSENTNMSSSQKSSLNSIISFAEELAHSGKDTAEQTEQIKIAFSGLKAEISETGRTGKNFFSQIRNRLTDMNSKFIAQFLSWQDWIMYIRQAAEMVTELNTQITELAKVSEDSVSQIYADFDSYANIAKEMGSTISDTIAATTAWSKNGYNIPDSKKLAEVSLLYKNVGDGINIDEANDSLVSTLKGFKLEADQAEHIVDVLNEVSNNEAISSSGIGEALQRSAASFNAANTSLEKSVALVTATNSVLQDPEKVGNMWKTVSARIRGAKSELAEMGEDTDDMVESTSKLRDLVKGITGFDIMKDENTFKDIYDIIIGISEKWDTLSDIDQASLLENLAGKNQSNALAAALSNVDLLKKSYEEATNAEGSARKEQEKYTKSIKYSIDKAKASLEELANDFLSSDFLKGSIDFGEKIITFLDKIIDKIGVLPTLLTAIGAALSFKNVGIDTLVAY